MTDLIQQYSRENKSIVRYGLYCLKESGMTAQWYVDNFATQLKRLKLEIDMGIENRNIRIALPEEHPLLPVAELFMEMQLLYPYKPELCGIPVNLPSNFVGHVCAKNEGDFEGGGQIGNSGFTIFDLANSSEEHSLAAYKHGFSYMLKSISSASYDDIMQIAVGNPAAILYIDSKLITPAHWKSAMISDFSYVVSQVPAEAIDPDVFISKASSLKNGLSCYLMSGKRSLTEIKGIDRNKMFNLCTSRLDQIASVADYFTEDELIKIMVARPITVSGGEIIGRSERLDLAAVKCSYDSNRHEEVVRKLSNHVMKKAIDLKIINFDSITKETANNFSGEVAYSIKKKARMVIRNDFDIPF